MKAYFALAALILATANPAQAACSFNFKGYTLKWKISMHMSNLWWHCAYQDKNPAP